MTTHAIESPLEAPAQGRQAAPLRLAHTDWLYHHLDIAGSAAALEKFAEAAAGSGTIPWHLDLDQVEEDAFHTLAGAGTLSLHGAHVVAGQLRDAVGRRHRLAVDRIGSSRACPFDLHALLPVPDHILSLGPYHPDAVSWLWTAWGTTEALRHVTRRPAPVPTRLSIAFWSADWTPWRTLEWLRVDRPDLCFSLRPSYGRD